MIWSDEIVSGDLRQSLASTIGEGPAAQLQQLLSQHHEHRSGWLGALLGTLTLLLSATGMFNQLHKSFERIWKLEPPKRGPIMSYVMKHISSSLILIFLGFILFGSIAAHSFISANSSLFGNQYWLTLAIENWASLILIAIGFSMLYRFVGNLPISWRLAFETGLVTALLFMLGKWLIGWYIGRSHVSSAFGAASVIALIMVWTYYLSQIIFLGAAYGYVRANGHSAAEKSSK